MLHQKTLSSGAAPLFRFQAKKKKEKKNKKEKEKREKKEKKKSKVFSSSKIPTLLRLAIF